MSRFQKISRPSSNPSGNSNLASYKSFRLLLTQEFPNPFCAGVWRFSGTAPWAKAIDIVWQECTIASTHSWALKWLPWSASLMLACHSSISAKTYLTIPCKPRLVILYKQKENKMLFMDSSNWIKECDLVWSTKTTSVWAEAERKTERKMRKMSFTAQSGSSFQ